VRALTSGWGRVGALAANAQVVDALIAAALTALAQAQLLAATAWWLRLLMLVATGALAWRRWSPLTVAATVAAAVAVMGLSSDPPSVFGEYLAVMFATFTVAERCRLELAALGGALLLGGIVAHDWQSPEYGSVGGIASDTMIPLVIWLVGRAVHQQRTRADRSRELVRQLERERQELTRLAVTAERAHLARELHDVVTHSVSVVVIQAQGARRLLDGERPEVGAALETIESAGRAALTEMRRLLGLLRDEDQHAARVPHPGLANLPDLLAQVRGAGLPVTMTVNGSPLPLAPGLDLSAYRIVQEALTNSLKYAGPATASLRIGWHADRLELCVADTGGGSPAAAGEGRGLLGMRERVAAHGGELETGPQPGGGFRVWCRLPVRIDT
jgi:signal transduction histidine kinase